MKQKGIRHALCAALTLLLSLQTVFSFGTMGSVSEAYAATAKVAFASSIAKTTLTKAKKAGSAGKTIAVANVSNYTNVYSGKGKGTLKGRLYRGSAAYVVKKSGKYSYISSGSLAGWVKTSSLVTGTKAKKFVASVNPKVATVTNSSGVYLRSGKSFSSKILVEVPKGTRMVVLSDSSTWLKVRLTYNVSGYVYRSYNKVEEGLYTGVTISQEKKLQKLVDAFGKPDAAKDSQSTKPTETSSAKETTAATKETTAAATTAANEGNEADFLESGSSGSSTSETSASLTIKDVNGTWESLGTYKLTAYCPGECCNGKWAGVTASGAKPTPSRTIAVDSNRIKSGFFKFGDKIRIEGDDTVYVIEDTGVRGDHLDILFATHDETGVFGVQYKNVYILREK